MKNARARLTRKLNEVKFTEKNIRNFWKKVNKEGPLPNQSNPHYEGLDQCWVWTACLDSGYGRFKILDSMFFAHRVSWVMHNSHLDMDSCVLHKCDTPACVNPAHLYLGTHTDNMRDMQRKGRSNHPVGDRSPLRKYPEKVMKGEKHPGSKLTESQVMEIRFRHSDGNTKYVKTSKDFGVSDSLISRVVRRKSWTHLP